MALDDIEREEGINLDDPLVKFFRKVHLEAVAKKQDSDLYCSDCNTHLPYTQMTIGQEWDGVDANLNPAKKVVYHCTLCKKDFYEE